MDLDGHSLLARYSRFDIGDVVRQEKLDIHADETLPELYGKLAGKGADVLVDVMGELPHVLASSRPQEEIGITYGNSSLSVVREKHLLIIFPHFSSRHVT